MLIGPVLVFHHMKCIRTDPNCFLALADALGQDVDPVENQPQHIVPKGFGSPP
jgi:hypothetical protein